jgi:hypothetical protein
MKILCTNIFIFLSFHSFLYGQTFSIRYPGELNSAGSAIMEINDGFIAVIAAIDTLNEEVFSKIRLERLNQNGEVVQSQEYGNPDWICEFNQDAMTQLSDGTFVIAARTKVDEGWAARIIHFTENTDTLSTSYIYSPSYTGDPESPTNWMTPMYLVNDGQDSLYLCAQTFSEANANNFCIIKTNSEGEESWHYLYEPDHAYDICLALVANTNELYVCAGSQNDPEDENVSDEYFLRLNPQGQLIYEHIEQSGINAAIPQEFVVDSEGIVLVSSLDDQNEGFNGCIFKVDFSNALLWQETVENTGFRSGFQNIVADCFGGYTCSGIEDIYDVVDYPNSPQNQRVLLNRYDVNGNEIWSRTFYFLEVPLDEHRMRDLKQCSDGGYILIGEANDMTIDSEWTVDAPRQQTWVLKVDACGCLIPGCDSNCNPLACNLNQIEEHHAGYFAVLSQNPSGNVFIQTNQWVNQHQLVVKAYNELGAEVLSLNVINGGTYILPAERIKSGFYVFALYSENGQLASQKIIR